MTNTKINTKAKFGLSINTHKPRQLLLCRRTQLTWPWERDGISMRFELRYLPLDPTVIGGVLLIKFLYLCGWQRMGGSEWSFTYLRGRSFWRYIYNLECHFVEHCCLIYVRDCIYNRKWSELLIFIQRATQAVIWLGHESLDSLNQWTQLLRFALVLPSTGQQTYCSRHRRTRNGLHWKSWPSKWIEAASKCQAKSLICPSHKVLIDWAIVGMIRGESK